MFDASDDLLGSATLQRRAITVTTDHGVVPDSLRTRYLLRAVPGSFGYRRPVIRSFAFFRGLLFGSCALLAACNPRGDFSLGEKLNSNRQLGTVSSELTERSQSAPPPANAATLGSPQLFCPMLPAVCPNWTRHAGESFAALASQNVYVSLTFDDGQADSMGALLELAHRGHRATLYVNSGLLGGTGRLTWQQLKILSGRAPDPSGDGAQTILGHEVAGHTAGHWDLNPAMSHNPENGPPPPQPTLDTQTAQICGDKLKLTREGYVVKSFAYPYGHYIDTPEARTHELLSGCGYQTARRTTGLCMPTADRPVCDRLNRFGETIPPADAWHIRSYPSLTKEHTLEDVECRVRAAELEARCDESVRWLPLTFHHIDDDDLCLTAQGGDLGVCWPRSRFTALLDYLEAPEPLNGEQDLNFVRVVAMDEVSGAVAPEALQKSVTNGNLTQPHGAESTATRAACFQWVKHSRVDVPPPFARAVERDNYFEQIVLSPENQQPYSISIDRNSGAGSCAPYLYPDKSYSLAFDYRAKAESGDIELALWTYDRDNSWVYLRSLEEDLPIDPSGEVWLSFKKQFTYDELLAAAQVAKATVKQIENLSFGIRVQNKTACMVRLAADNFRLSEGL